MQTHGITIACDPSGNSRHARRGASLMILAGLLLLTLVSCKDPAADVEPRKPPNVLWVVWDTVRADHLSLYGHSRPTTPALESWAKSARVFDNCVSAAPTTTPSHASMFTGLLPSEHGANDQHRHLADGYATVAKLLGRAGYQTYLFSANPHICRRENFTQGFDVVEHPWDPQYRQAAFNIVRNKISPLDKSSELPEAIESGHVQSWHIKACGELAQRGTEAWLAKCDPKRPFFVFLNYMEAHRPRIPTEAYRRRMMTPAQVEQSYQVDRSWVPMWAYTFGLHEYTAEQLALVAATYDATLAELDDLFRNLLTALEASGHLDDTVIILTADHGEHLGEKHMLDHQYSVYEQLLRVPLIVHYPKRFAAGREARPVSTLDLFPTILELAGVEPPADWHSKAVSLLTPRDTRPRLAEYPAAFRTSFERMQRAYPNWDPRPWERWLRAFYDGDYKYIWASDGRHELYNVREDPHELTNLLEQTELAQRAAAGLADYVGTLQPAGTPTEHPGAATEADLRRLAGLGYADLPEDEEVETQDEDEESSTSAPAPKTP